MSRYLFLILKTELKIELCRFTHKKVSIISRFPPKISQSRTENSYSRDLVSCMGDQGRDPLDQNFRKFRYKIEWNRTFLETHFENFGQPPEVVPFSGNLEIPGISCSIGHYHSVSSSSRPKRWRRQVFSPAVRMFLRFTRHRIILMTHFNVSDATTRFVQFWKRSFLILSSAMSRNRIVNENKSYSGRTDRYLERLSSK